MKKDMLSIACTVAARDESPSDEWNFPVSSLSTFADDRRSRWSSSGGGGGGGVWFRAAVITVPIVGLVALVLLVVVASHLLNAESRSHSAAYVERRRAATFWRRRGDVQPWRPCRRPDAGTRTLPRYEKIISCVCSNVTSYHYPRDAPTDNAESSITV